MGEVLKGTKRKKMENTHKKRIMTAAKEGKLPFLKYDKLRFFVGTRNSQLIDITLIN